MKLSAFGRVLAGSALCAGLVLLAPTDLRAQNACSTTNDVFMNPFNRQSAHHLPIGTGARYAGDNHPATRDWLKANSFGMNIGGSWGTNVAATGSSDVVRQVNGRTFGPGRNVIGLPASIRLPRNGLITTIELNQSNNFDGVAVVHDRVAGTTHELYQYDWNNGSPVASIHRRYDIRGLGHGTSPGQRVGVTATGVSSKMGLLLGDQINTRGHRIEHALQMVLPYKRPNECNIMLSMDMILPATTRDGHAGQAGANRGNIRYGELLALPRHVDLNSLGLSEPGMRLARAIQGYGIRVVDGGGCGAGAIRADQYVSPQVRDQLRNDIPKIYPHIRVVTNGEWRPGLTAIGGGQPIAPNCAFDAGATNVAAPVSTSPPPSNVSTGQGSGDAPSSGASNDQTTSPGGSLQWPATRNAQNYYLVIREGSNRGPKVFDQMVSPQEAGCAGGQGSCSLAMPPLPAGRQYAWAARAVVNGNVQAANWQQVESSNDNSSTPTEQSSTPPPPAQTSTPNASPSNGSTSPGAETGSLSWAAVSGAASYYFVIREGSSRGPKVFDRMVRPQEAGCGGGQGTCSLATPPLPAGKQYVWAARASVNGGFQPANWQQVASSSGGSSTSNAQSDTPSVPQTASTSPGTSDGSLSWSASSGASSYYLVIRERSGTGPKAFDGMVRPQEAGCANGQGTCSQPVPPLTSATQHVWNVRAVVNGRVQSLKLPSWRPLR